MGEQERAKRTKYKIIEAAAQVFFEHGYDGAKIEQILTAAGVTKGALYHHYRSKQEIADALLQQHVGDIAVEPQDVKLLELVVKGQRLVEGLQRDAVQRAAARLTLEEGSNQLDRKQAMSLWAEYVEALLVEAGRRHELLASVNNPERIRKVAEMYVGAFAGIQLLADVTSEGHNRAGLQHQLTVFFEHTLPTIAAPHVLPHLRRQIGG
ncbi:ScbR family autoregulator-binding transcription factor [Streptomyces sp. NPDC056149]|uniref:ScbR family autoregulator-binding transcription factor n=1 Tax=unclassified Streptomyces TaxID=2593676 RepID=UPI002381585C|nr:ScbR family autoregulator-binding transcription factor [Streptomyces sp. WZ-12]